uniref:SLPL deltaD2 (LMW SLP D2 truncation),SLPL deltaD2 (LMW SLP D2 truncation) n=1 Tax=Clostridioides difficile (strain R20291) TaxID=645463 RepID=UPI001F0CDDE2|nr:Chain A, SLPL deltaD2 (LMW SLP D2 truncation),SLPL deltaD2 (LMW SLP D2 truncation) [Clostridioides difficile R20291]7ACZ_C Chain C, SLPL deltaD2 (LMW SLP D2 truncation),SLPL deltaD2 (LMW SLP D2 truncation) [Clostridioides difficile R20291]
AEDMSKVETGDQGYTVVQSKYKKAVEQLQKGLLDGSITEIKIFFEGTLASTIKVGAELSAEDASKLLFTQVDNKLDNLGDGDYVDFLISSGGSGSPVITKLRILNAKEETIDIDASSSKTAQDLAKKYVFNKTDLNTLYRVLNGDEADTNRLVEEVSGKYQVVLYPEGKRVTTKSAA